MNELAPSPSQQGLPQHGLLSLWDMVKFFRGQALARLGQLSYAVERQGYDLEDMGDGVHHKHVNVFPIEDEERETMLSMIEATADAFSLPHINEMCQQRREQDVLMNVQIQDLLSDLIRSLDTNRYLWIAPDRAAYIGRDDLISENAKNAFPAVAEELSQAAACYAFGQGTASVFHSMRAAEGGVRVIARHLGVSISDHDEMKKAVDGVRKAARDLENKPNYQGKKDDSQFYSEIGTDAGLFKDAWRNYVAHAHVSYEPEQAKKILDAVCDFYERVATRFSSANP